MIVLEDLHWVDPSTMELTQTLVEQCATLPLLFLYTARPEFQASWPMREHHAQLRLNRLSKRNVRKIITNVAANRVPTNDVVETLVNRTGGVPLFAEELTRAVLQSGGRTAHEIPATLADSLMAQLDRLGSAKEVARVASVIGRESSYELLRAVSPLAEDELRLALTKLADAELIYARGIPPDVEYQFKHALIQDTAYQSLLNKQRQHYHNRIGKTLEERFPDAVASEPEVLAHHYSEAGMTAEAIRYWRKAAQRAVQRSANTEAIAHLTRALEMLKLQSDTETNV